jgi:hypothetical protein
MSGTKKLAHWNILTETLLISNDEESCCLAMECIINKKAVQNKICVGGKQAPLHLQDDATRGQ